MNEDLILTALSRLEEGQAKLQDGQAKLEVILEERLAKLDDRLAKLEDRLGKLEDRLAKLEDGHTRLRVELMARMDRLQDSLTAVRDDIAVNMGAADAMQRANDNTRDMVRAQSEQLSALWRQLKALEARVREITGDP